MADFVAVLKKTIDAQADKSPELRQRVYAKARATIEQKLVTANASQAVAVRQRKLLDDAIDEVEAHYAPPAAAAAPQEPQFDPLEDFLNETREASGVSAPKADEPVVTPEIRHRAKDKPVEGRPVEGRPVEDKIAAKNGSSAKDEPAFKAERDDDWSSDRGAEPPFTRRGEYALHDAPKEKRSYKGLIIGLIAVLALGGAGYAGWVNKDRLQELASSLGRSDAPRSDGQTETPAKPDETTTPPAEQANGGEQQQQPQQPAGEQKMTQRLMPDGSEVDSGPAGGTPGIGEGKSTAASTPGSNEQTNTQPQQPGQAVAVGQQALLYEETGGTESGTVKRGNVVWSVIEESPTEGEPAQPAIRGTVTIPDSKVELKLTISKNTDQSIPASHLIEMVFTVPEDFPGGVIDNVQRVTFKDTEQAAGNPLIAVPSKIADNFFIIWLNDARTAQDTNLSLMRRLQWIDIPVSYRNGRRALISLEKGVPGEKAFNDVLGTN